MMECRLDREIRLDRHRFSLPSSFATWTGRRRREPRTLAREPRQGF
jgi:hypothetical protein